MRAESVRPLLNLCLVYTDDREETVAGGLLYLPTAETTPEKLSQGTGSLVRLGNGKKIKSLGLKAGDRIAYRGYLKYANPVEDDDKSKKFMIISVDDIIGVIADNTSVGVFSSPVTGSRPKEKT